MRRPSQKVAWSGVLTAAQPRIRLTRSFDQLSHTYQGYVLRVTGPIGPERREFLVAVGKSAHEKHQFRIGAELGGEGVPVNDPRIETAELYRVSKLEVHSRGPEPTQKPPPWHGVPPSLSVYRERGHRRLAARTYETRCISCIWGCKMAVEIIIDQWNPRQRRYRAETFCYGPLSCPIYKSGPNRTVPGRRGMTWVEEDWIDQEETSHRNPDE